MQSIAKIYDHRHSNSWAAQMRKKRLSLFNSLLATLPAPIKILDVGGKEDFYESANFFGREGDLDITLINVSLKETGTIHPNIQKIVGDARDMQQFTDNEFDVVFSNSVIEHVGDYSDQLRMANEIKRVSKRYFVQTPNRYFPIEPHFLFPFFQFLPIDIRVWLLIHFDLGWYEKIPNQQIARDAVLEIRLLSQKELVHLFPEAKLFKEKLFGLTKSLTVYAGWHDADTI
ncbi:MAG TPA: methyltransferase domain-containing protein [Methylococcales bacterium]